MDECAGRSQEDGNPMTLIREPKIKLTAGVTYTFYNRIGEGPEFIFNIFP